jgi:hypothetical protein
MQTTINAASSIIRALFEPFASAKIDNRDNEEGKRHKREQQIRHSAPQREKLWHQNESSALALTK